MRAFLLVAALVIFTPFAPSAVTPVLVDSSQDWSGIDQRVGDSVLRVVAQDLEQTSSGSGVVINRKAGFVLTAAHVIPAGTDGRSITVDGKDASLIKINYLVDLALLRVDDLRANSLQLRSAPTNVGLPVAIAGFAIGAHQVKYTFGHVSDRAEKALMGTATPPWLSDAYYVDAEILNGHSGGIVVDAQGHIVGLIQAGISLRGSSLGLVAPVSAIRAFAGSYFESEAAK